MNLHRQQILFDRELQRQRKQFGPQFCSRIGLPHRRRRGLVCSRNDSASMKKPGQLGQCRFEGKPRAPFTCGQKPRAVIFGYRATAPFVKLLGEFLWSALTKPGVSKTCSPRNRQ